MSYVRRKYIHGNWYLYLVHGERVNGKVVQIIDEYLGPEEPKRIEDEQERKFFERRKEIKVLTERL